VRHAAPLCVSVRDLVPLSPQVSLLAYDESEGNGWSLEHECHESVLKAHHVAGDVDGLPAAKHDSPRDLRSDGRAMPLAELVPQTAFRTFHHLERRPPDLEHRALGEWVGDAIVIATRVGH